MVQCPGRSADYPALSPFNSYAKCLKKAKSQPSEWAKINDERHCHGCGVIWKFLDGDYCAACKKNPGVVQNPQSLALQIGYSADLKEKEASHSRLHQKKPAAIQAARDKLDVLRRTTKPGFIKLEADLWYWPRTGGKSKQTQMDPFCDKSMFSQNAEIAMQSLLTVAQKKHSMIPDGLSKPHLTFERIRANFSVVQGNGIRHSIDDYELGDNTIEKLLTQLKERDLLTGKAEKESKLSIRITVFEKEVEADDDDLNSSQPVFRSATTRRTGKRRAKSAPTIDSPTSKRSRGKDQDSDSDDIIIPSTSSSAAPFRSAFLSLKTVADEASTFKYGNFEFRRKEYQVDETGVTTLVKHTAIEEVEVVTGWQKYKKGGKPAGGFLSKGFRRVVARY